MGWTWKDIQANGSNELKEIIFIITGGIAPKSKEDEEYEQQIKKS